MYDKFLVTLTVHTSLLKIFTFQIANWVKKPNNPHLFIDYSILFCVIRLFIEKKTIEKITIKVKKTIGLRLKILDLFVLIETRISSFFFKKSENIWIIVIVVFYKNNVIFATRSTQKTLILLSILTNIRLDL